MSNSANNASNNSSVQREVSCNENPRTVTPDCVPEVYSERFVYEIGYVPTYDGETDMSRPYWWTPSTNDFNNSRCSKRVH